MQLASSGSQPGPAILVADLQDAAALQAMTRRAKVVLSYVGPFEKYGGENLIKAALSTCTHYVDIDGETNWQRDMIRRYEGEARARGLAVVQAAGLDSLVPDLISMLAAEGVAADGQGPPTAVSVLWSKINGWASGGTAASNDYARSHHSSMGPYALAPEATQVPPGEATGLFWQDQAPYFASEGDTQVIHRSMALRFPRAGISVSEAMGEGVGSNLKVFLTDPRMEADPPPTDLRPGEGPPAWMLQDGSFAAEARAKRSADGRMKAIRLDGAGDPGYQACAKFSVEIALGLAREGPAILGFPTPSLALGAVRLREILEAADGGRLMNFTDV